jgi:hypothetical protein
VTAARDGVARIRFALDGSREWNADHDSGAISPATRRTAPASPTRSSSSYRKRGFEIVEVVG